MTPRIITRLSITAGLIVLAVALTLSRAIPNSPVPLPPPLAVTPLPPGVLPGPPAPTAQDRFRADMEALKDPIVQPVATPAPVPQPQPTYAPQPENRRRGIFRR